ncbi:Elastase-1 [Channa argus]|uniref:Elastase-1 n=1 Tax=Channa argus TaxID=215402 RepID=A0A6G1PIL1_CHAAH|nr:Elastase-1 [Channa argus]
MLPFLLFTALTATVLAELELQSNYTELSPAGRVVGGQDVPNHTSWPWQVSLTSYVKLASLPRFGEILPHNNPCYITGYGRISTGGSMSSRMKQASLPIVDHQTCTSSGWWGSTVKTTMICAGGGAQSGCNGDFGGPLSCKVNNSWYVHGIASFVSGMGCNTPQKPTVFTRVSAYIEWMNSL